MYYKIDFDNIKLDFDANEFWVLDQKLLPFEEKYISLKSVNDVYNVIKEMNVRGAPLIGVVALLGLYLGNSLENDMEFLKSARPTAVNIFNYFNQFKKYLGNHRNYKEKVVDFIFEVIQSEEEKNINIAKNGLNLIKGLIEEDKKVVNFLTHCNTGSLATVGLGTALGIIKYTHREYSGKKVCVWVDETRPYLQGSRLTAWELKREGIDFKIITDNAAAYVMSQGLVDFVIVGADRIARNGDTSNKIGTLNLAVLCKYFNIPFVVAAPNSSVDYNLDNLALFHVEERNKEEVIKIGEIFLTDKDYEVYNPSFDITPHTLIDYIVLDTGVYSRPYGF
ncbi:MAG: S-methyl-5-thioribose-1-phosphate isomerase [Candidatus Calescibacterium sp.]|nr:S-methyl-5-thioribose-1-phosphate isomerase [Candidatus Calescibacterium sp.]